MAIYQSNRITIVPSISDAGDRYVLLGNMTADKAVAIDAEANVHYLHVNGTDTFAGLTPGAHMRVLPDRDTAGRRLFERIHPVDAHATTHKKSSTQYRT